MQVVYEGPFEAVQIPVLGLEVERGVPFTVDDGAGEALTAQADFHEVEGKPRPKRKTKTTEDDTTTAAADDNQETS